MKIYPPSVVKGEYTAMSDGRTMNTVRTINTLSDAKAMNTAGTANAMSGAETMNTAGTTNAMSDAGKAQKTFRRIEKKYLITDEQYGAIISAIRSHTVPDAHKSDIVSSLYFDTPDYLLIRRSLDKPVYKEKLRLRTYGVPSEGSPVFLEIKKKFKKVVYKRRAELSYRDAVALLTGRPYERDQCQQQIINELSLFMERYGRLRPSMLISYRRSAYYGIENRDLRITFDENILWRDKQLSPLLGSWGEPILDDGLRLMEIKIPGAMPLWLSHLLSEAQIYPVSFSKYGTAYKTKLSKGEINYA